MSREAAPLIDGLQYCNWSRKIFDDMAAGGLDAVHVTLSYHEDLRETIAHIARWNRRFQRFSDRILLGREAADVERAKESKRTAVFLGLQTAAPIQDDIGLVNILHTLGVRFMQLTYNNQSLLASGYCEPEDGGLTRMGREVIAEMNRVGMVVDMSHSGERSTLEAIEHSQRPVAVTHANPDFWHRTPRNKSQRVLEALAESGGVLGLSLYPLHLAGGHDCTLDDFCAMTAQVAEIMGEDKVAIGSDLCQDQPGELLRWMRSGRWTVDEDEEEHGLEFPPQPSWFRSNRDFPRLAEGLLAAGFDSGGVAAILGGNWLDFFRRSFSPRGRTE